MDDPVAICGYGYLLPGGLENDQDLLDLLENRGCVQELIDKRYGKGEVPWDGFVDSPGRVASPYEGLITGGKELEFDCSLFGIALNEAERMDPQIKMMLMATWDALQCAGMDQAELNNSNTGVFVGHQDSSIQGWKSSAGAHPADVPGRAGSMIANRISFHFNWMGPSLSIATACSSGISALDAAMKSLRIGECDLAAFGAVSYLGLLHASVGFNALGIISKTASCRSFDKDPNGYMRSEGAFVFILKRLRDAERDGDKVFGVIRSCAINTAGAQLDAEVLTQGRTIFAPTSHGQAALMTKVLEQAGVLPNDVDYVEAHATGTNVGDPVEGDSIATVYGSSQRDTPLRLASMRSNVGHMEAASFTSSLLKVLLMLDQRQFLPISSHFKKPNPSIPFEASNMRVQTICEQFPDHKKVIIGINSFGFGGSNGSCLVEEYLSPENWSSLPGGLVEGKVYMVPLSAKTEDALVESARRLADKIGDLQSSCGIYTLTANLSVRMTHHRVRKAFFADSLSELREQLIEFTERADATGLEGVEIVRLKHLGSTARTMKQSRQVSPSVAMVFSGQGSQWAGCGRELYETELVFRRVVDAIDVEWMKLSGSKLTSVAFDTEAEQLLQECRWAQPVTFLLQVGVFEVLKAHGVHARAVLGHSSGEAAAAYASGAYTLEEACCLVYHRSRLQQKLAGSGHMLVLMQGSEAVKSTLSRLGFQCGDSEESTRDYVEIACFNSPNSTVICGTNDAIERLQERLETHGQQGKLIRGSIAFHSRHMMSIRDQLLESLRPMDEAGKRSCLIPMISTVTGSVQTSLDAEYWWSNVRQPVNLLAAVDTLRRDVRPKVLIELSPHITLRWPIRDCYIENGDVMPIYIHSLVRRKNAAMSFAHVVGSCFEANLPVDFRSLYPRPRPITHLLPPYAIKRKPVIDYLIDDSALGQKETFSAGPLLGKEHRYSLNMQIFETVVSRKHFSWMADHKVQGRSILPASAYVELLLEAFHGDPIRIVSARLLSRCELTEKPNLLQTSLTPLPHASNRFEFKVTSLRHPFNDVKMLHCSGVVEKLDRKKPENSIPPGVELSRSFSPSVPSTMESYPDKETFYEAMAARMGDVYSYGPWFCTVTKAEKTENDELHYEVALDDDKWDQWDRMGYILHPTLLDGVLQAPIVHLMNASNFVSVPQTIEDFVFLRKPNSGRIKCVHIPLEVDIVDMHKKGQFTLGLGESNSGTFLIYDELDDLIAYMRCYTTFNLNKNKSDLRKVKHFLSWQPKDDCRAEIVAPPAIDALTARNGVDVATKLLISEIITKAHPDAGVPFFLNVGECIVGMPPARLALEACMNVVINAPVQFTLLSSDSEFLIAKYQEIGKGNQDAHLRFVLSEDTAGGGFLRPALFELLVVHLTDSETDLCDADEELRRLAKYVSPGGLLLAESVHPVKFPSSWVCIWKTLDHGEDNLSITLLHSVNSALEDYAGSSMHPIATAEALSEICVIVDDHLGFAEYWRKVNVCADRPGTAEFKDDAEIGIPDVTNSTVNRYFDFAEACRWERVDYFAMDDREKDDSPTVEPELFVAPAKLTDWVKQFAAQRSGATDLVTCLFTVYTSGAVRDVTSPSQTGVWGAVRSLATELGDACRVDFRLVDLATKEDLRISRGLEAMRERELCLQDGHIWTSRLINNREVMPLVELCADGNAAYRLQTDNSGDIDDLQFFTYELSPLGPHDVEILVKAAALNFRDIMVGLGKLPLKSFERSKLGQTVGIECSGVVELCGNAVSELCVGDKVVTSQGGCIANRLRCNEKAAFRMPSNLSYEQGASVLSVYVTAYYSLCYLARMREGQTILVHSALGGVGQAAIALAKMCGARVYATAGSEGKRETLRSMGCVDAFDSHSTGWFHDLMKATCGRGVNIVLNSLAGEHVDLCLQALAPCGWHCEIGKVDILSDRPVNLGVFRKNLNYLAIDMDRLMMDDPELVAELTVQCLNLLQQEKVPPLPVSVFSYHDYKTPLHNMMNGLHSGKLVLIPPKDSDTLRVIDSRPLFGCSGDGEPRTVLLSGCLGGLGHRILTYVISLGARHVLLLDRDKQRRRSVEHLLVQTHLKKYQDCFRIEIIYADVSKYTDVAEVIASVPSLGLPPIGSVFHLAGVLDDKLVGDIDRESFKRVYEPKANGAWNLHRATLACEKIEHFVMFSSTSSIFGNPGQTNYSAANSFQDGLAALRRQSGKPALSFCLCAVVEEGMAARDPKLLQLMKATGMPAVSCVFAIECLDSALRGGKYSNTVVVHATHLAADEASSDFLRAMAQLVDNSAAFKLGARGDRSKQSIMNQISARLAELCGVEEVNVNEAFSSYGLSSLAVTELMLFLQNEMSYSVSPMELMTTATVESIVDGVLGAPQGVPEVGDLDSLEVPVITGTAEDSTLADAEFAYPHVQLSSRFAPSLQEHFSFSRGVKDEGIERVG